MDEDPDLETRKAEHIRINLEENVQSGVTNGLENYRLIHSALPDLDLANVNCCTSLFGRNLGAPILISSMTGGTAQALQINQRLAEGAQASRIAMGVGSQRVGLENSELMSTFKVRKTAPDVLLLANLGAVQLNYGYSIEHCHATVDALEADALILHLNPLQEALMEDGNTNFAGLLEKIEHLCGQINVPVIVKEVGWGISPATARQLHEAGVTAIDVAGAGGTSWSEVEKYRSKDQIRREIAAGFSNWGIPTADAFMAIQAELPDLPLIASGGIRDGVEMAKCLAMGAILVGAARPFLLAAVQSEQKLRDLIFVLTEQIRISLFSVGAQNLNELRDGKIQRITP